MPIYITSSDNEKNVAISHSVYTVFCVYCGDAKEYTMSHEMW